MKRLVLISIFAAVAVVSVQADYFGFNPITTNAPNRDAIGDQLFMSVSTLSATDSGVLFTNIGPASSSISEIYFGSNLTALDLNIESILASSPGVVFDITGATPPNPPGWNEFANWWSVTIAAAESTAPPSQNGINPTEFLELELSYDSGSTLFELIQAGEVQVAMHVIDLNGYSDTFVNTQSTVFIPEPSSVLLIGSAAFLGIFVRRRFNG